MFTPVWFLNTTRSPQAPLDSVAGEMQAVQTVAEVQVLQVALLQLRHTRALSLYVPVGQFATGTIGWQRKAGGQAGRRGRSTWSFSKQAPPQVRALQICLLNTDCARALGHLLLTAGAVVKRSARVAGGARTGRAAGGTASAAGAAHASGLERARRAGRH